MHFVHPFYPFLLFSGFNCPDDLNQKTITTGKSGAGNYCLHREKEHTWMELAPFNSGKITCTGSDGCRDAEMSKKYVPKMHMCPKRRLNISRHWHFKAKWARCNDVKWHTCTKLCGEIQGRLRWARKWVKRESKNHKIFTLILLLPERDFLFLSLTLEMICNSQCADY